MPRGVKIGITVVFAISAVVLAWSLYYNFYLVWGGWVTALQVEASRQEQSNRISYQVAVRDRQGQIKKYALPYRDAANMQLGDRVQLRPKDTDSARLIRSRRPNLAEMTTLASRVVEVEVGAVTFGDRWAPEADVKIKKQWKPTDQQLKQDQLTIALGVPWLNEGDMTAAVALQPGERAVVFLDEQNQILFGASGVIERTL